MLVAVTGPILLDPLRPWLDESAEGLPPGRGGTPVTAIVTELLDRGHDVVVATLDHRLREPVEASGPNLRVSVGPFRPSGRARDAFRVERRFIRDALLRHRPEIIHAHWTYEYALGALATDIPTVVTVRDWGPTILRFHRDAYRTVRLGMQVACLMRSRNLTVTSPMMQEHLRRWLRRDVPLVPNAIADALADPAPSPPSSRAPIVLCVSNGFSNRKNTTALLRAWPRVHAAHPGLRLRMVGADHGPGEAAEEFARAHGLLDGVEFIGWRSLPDVMAEHRQARLLAHPALEESFGLVLVESMAQGTPVLGGEASGAVPWVLDHGRAGHLVDVTRPEAISEGLLAMLADPDLDALAIRGHRRAMEHFVVSRVVDDYLALYQEAMR